MRAIDLTGEQFGRLRVQAKSKHKDKYNHIQWICICDCGNMHEATTSALRSGN
jgi:hypothetical protein